MGFTDEVRQALIDRIGPGKRFTNNKRMADELCIDPSQLNRFLKKERGLNSDTLGHILDRIGATVVFGDEPADAAREVSFQPPEISGAEAGAPTPKGDDYMAVPLVTPATATTAGFIPEDLVEGWMLVWRHLDSLRFRSNLVAVKVDKSDDAMAPNLHPGDIVVVDRDDTDPTPAGKIMLVSEPGTTGDALLRRVAIHQLDNDLELVFYTDNTREFPPSTFRLNRDYGGDIGRAISGKVVWAWSDMAHK